jgi:hypothetical protein
MTTATVCIDAAVNATIDVQPLFTIMPSSVGPASVWIGMLGHRPAGGERLAARIDFARVTERTAALST